MLTSLLAALAWLAGLLALWLAVQRLWQRHFPENSSPDGDALAGRGGCHGCTCKPGHCEAQDTRPNHTTEANRHAP
jgi:hypothetical protein